MTLTFLGQAYEATANEMAPIPSEKVGQYRGAVTRFSTSRVPLAPMCN